jgi:GTP cyclohydrolase I
VSAFDRVITYLDIEAAAAKVASKIIANRALNKVKGTCRLYGVPRGGIPAAMAVQVQLSQLGVPSRLEAELVTCDYVIDDLFDSGATYDRIIESNDYKGQVFLTLFEKKKGAGWYIFPWEKGDVDTSADDICTRMLQYIGEDVGREGLQETPARYAKALKQWFSGYGKNPADVLKVFTDGAQGVDEMVLETDIPVYSFCEHHMAPIFGVAHVAYIPNGKVVGLSKLVRLVDIFARRLQVQERLTNDITSALEENLDAQGVGVVLQCRHFCMESRGVCKSGVVTTTSSLRGALKHEPSARAEFFSLIEMSKSRHNSIL